MAYALTSLSLTIFWAHIKVTHGIDEDSVLRRGLDPAQGEIRFSGSTFWFWKLSLATDL